MVRFDFFVGWVVVVTVICWLGLFIYCICLCVGFMVGAFTLWDLWLLFGSCCLFCGCCVTVWLDCWLVVVPCYTGDFGL